MRLFSYIVLGVWLGCSPAGSQDGDATVAGDVVAARHGKHTVGTRFEIWTDARREEEWTPTHADAREVGVRWFYPARQAGDRPRAALFVQGDTVPDAMEASWGVRPRERVLEAYVDAPALVGSVRRPVVLLSHGMTSGHWSMTQLALDLASSGYVVAALEHPFHGLTFRRASGAVISPTDGANSTLGFCRLKTDQAMQDLLQVMSEDQRFVAGRIHSIAAGQRATHVAGLAQAIDAERIFVGGHSLGGMAADRSCIRYRVFDACFSLDGIRWLPLLAGWAPSTDKPLLVVFSDAFFHGQKDRRFAERYLSTFQNLAAFLVAGSKHDSFVNIQSLFSTGTAATETTPLHRRVQAAHPARG